MHMEAEMRRDAQSAMIAMQDAALRARTLHARAELMRHMLTTAAKLRGRPDAVPGVVAEWMAAWALDPATWPTLASAMRAFTEATCRYEADPSDATDAGWRSALAALDVAMSAHGLTLADQMAWRSECAHRWWHAVAPPPADLPVRASVPAADTRAPFWSAGCAAHCRK